MKKSKEKCAGPQYEKAENHCSKQKVVLANFETLSKWKMKRIEEASEPHPPAMKTHPHPIQSQLARLRDIWLRHSNKYLYNDQTIITLDEHTSGTTHAHRHTKSFPESLENLRRKKNLQ